jgi:hypothetical protein
MSLAATRRYLPRLDRQALSLRLTAQLKQTEIADGSPGPSRRGRASRSPDGPAACCGRGEPSFLACKKCSEVGIDLEQVDTRKRHVTYLPTFARLMCAV